MMFETNELVEDRILKSREIVVGFKITGNATPASKTHYVDLPDAVYLISEGLTSDAYAIEDVSASIAAPSDANGKFSMLLDTDYFADKFDALVDVRVVGKASETATATTTVLAVTSGSNIIFDVDTSANLASDNFDAWAIIKYRAKK